MVENFSGHCFRNSIATIAVDAGADMMAIKGHGRWTYDATAQGYVDNLKMAKIKVASIFNRREISTDSSSDNAGIVQ